MFFTKSQLSQAELAAIKQAGKNNNNNFQIIINYFSFFSFCLGEERVQKKKRETEYLICKSFLKNNNIRILECCVDEMQECKNDDLFCF